jgi:prepilin signal peptidase PulO-like enzyme (type II secretory pathway)
MSMVYSSIAFVGLIFGSFAGAQVWRLRGKQLIEDKRVGEPYDKNELQRLAPLATKSGEMDRSRCLQCHHTLAWYDLLPLVSWLSTGGRCRYCTRFIGWFEPLIELGMAALFFASTMIFLPQITSVMDGIQLGIWLVVCILLVILLAYDAKWFLLPDSINFSLMALAVGYAITTLYQQHFSTESFMSLAGALAILPGLYAALYYYSRGAWVGFGDVKLCIGLALFVGRWDLAFLALFLANCLGALTTLPLLATKKLTRKMQIPFGPFLIIGTIIAVLYGKFIIDWYMSVSLGIFV